MVPLWMQHPFQSEWARLPYLCDAIFSLCFARAKACESQRIFSSSEVMGLSSNQIRMASHSKTQACVCERVAQFLLTCAPPPGRSVAGHLLSYTVGLMEQRLRPVLQSWRWCRL